MDVALPAAIRAGVAAVADRLGHRVDISAARPLRLHDAATVLLPGDIVVRLVRISEVALDRARRAVALTSWLREQDFPSVQPAHPTPVQIPGYVATLWTYVTPCRAQSTMDTHAALGAIIRLLHGLPMPPFALPDVDPFARLRAALVLDASRDRPVVNASDTAFLTGRLDQLSARYSELRFPLAPGLIHFDAHANNLLPCDRRPYGFVLCDWESACQGPRELDLIPAGAPGNRFGRPESPRLAFTTSYGYDIGDWPDFSVLREIREIHSLASHIRSAPHLSAAATELGHRLASLRDCDRDVRWQVL